MLMLLVRASWGVLQQEITKIAPSVQFHKKEKSPEGGGEGRFQIVASMTVINTRIA